MADKADKKTKKELVIDVLKRNLDGLTIIEISKLLNISRNTTAVVLAELKGMDVIRIREVGKAKLHYWKGEAFNSSGKHGGKNEK